MSKTPDDVKKGLECCNNIYSCPDCPYDNGDESWGCTVEKNADALALIQQLQAQNAKLSGKIGQLETENKNLRNKIRRMQADRDNNCGHAGPGIRSNY